MAQIQTFDGIIARESAGFTRTEPFYGEFQTGRQTGMGMTAARMAWIAPVPNPLPTGVTAYRMIGAYNYSAAIYPILIAKMVLMGTLTGAGSSPGTFTDGAAMPVVTTLGNTGFQSYAGLWAEVSTAISGTITSFSTTWLDASSTSRTVSVNMTTGAVVGSGGFLSLNTFGAQSSQAQDVTAMSFVGASPTGVIKVYGAVPLVAVQGKYSGTPGFANNLTWQFQNIPLAAGDLLAVIGMGSNSATATVGSVFYLGDS